MIAKPRRSRALCGVVGSLAALVLLTAPVLAQEPSTAPLEGLIDYWRRNIIRILQAALTIVMAYYAGVLGISGQSGHAVKRLGMSLIAFAILEMFNRLVLDPVQNVGSSGNGGGSGGTTDAVGGVDPGAATNGIADLPAHIADVSVHAGEFAITALTALPV